MVSNSDRAITQLEISSIFRSSYDRVAAIEKAKRSFQTSRFYPPNPDVFTYEYFEPFSVTNRPDPTKEVEESSLGNSNDETER
jgi:hypothetical protein